MVPFGGEGIWDGHVLLVHDSEERRRLGIAAWARQSLEAGAKVLYIEPPYEPPDRSLLALLAAHEVEVGEAVERGQLEVFTADDHAYDPAWQTSVGDQALAEGYPTVRWSGEALTAWGVMPPGEHAAVEWATDELCRSRPVSVLCQYSAGLPQAHMRTVCGMHGHGVRESQLQVLPVRGGVALVGAVDASNERVVRSALEAASSPRDRAWFRVDLSGLEFLDVAGTRTFLTGTTTHRLRGGRVCLSGAHGTVARVLSLLGVDTADEFRVEAAS